MEFRKKYLDFTSIKIVHIKMHVVKAILSKNFKAFNIYIKRRQSEK